jgi:hypothetical protein
LYVFRALYIPTNLRVLEEGQLMEASFLSRWTVITVAVHQSHARTRITGTTSEVERMERSQDCGGRRIRPSPGIQAGRMSSWSTRRHLGFVTGIPEDEAKDLGNLVVLLSLIGLDGLRNETVQSLCPMVLSGTMMMA